MDITKYNTDDFNATYSPEDNKLRLYADVRIDQEDWLEMKGQGWRWAPKQELFYALWSVNREDFCLALAGDILPEEMTMVERAEAKADRLLILAQKRSSQCLGYQQAANDLMLRLDNNQPILGGHHSQRKAEKTALQVDRNIEKAKDTSQAVGYWIWRAQGVIDHADYKNNTRTIYTRIKGLLKDLRTQQKNLNDAAKRIDVILKVKNNPDQVVKAEHTKWLCGDYTLHHLTCAEQFKAGEITPDEALEGLMKACENAVNSPRKARVIGHILNRLGYEQGQLSTVFKYDGELSPAIIQTFLRTHGADKPKASKTDYGWLAVSDVCLPLHIGSSCELELDDQEWRELMQSVGYEVPAKKVTVPILNFKVDKPFTIKKLYDRGDEQLEQKEITKEEYNKIHKDSRWIRKSSCETFRFKTIHVLNDGACGGWDTTEYAVFITDSKAHPVPESMQAVEA